MYRKVLGRLEKQIGSKVITQESAGCSQVINLEDVIVSDHRSRWEQTSIWNSSDDDFFPLHFVFS